MHNLLKSLALNKNSIPQNIKLELYNSFASCHVVTRGQLKIFRFVSLSISFFFIWRMQNVLVLMQTAQSVYKNFPYCKLTKAHCIVSIDFDMVLVLGPL